ncbi:MAG: bifunctional (p)ppGpp synthetase/guanosine-3',5'-bis(diphosphate) 3'-pyrophosphohydrolase, partial [Sphingomonadales bacterium]|nr:bifunctional (p)ppGpp synthetase/guanosine-3',5'-bis(diphosphate) 3'-pyrophosphohydrolase [Sphingomonadales bacterium]
EMFIEVGKGTLKADEVLSAAFPGINIKHDKTLVPDAVSDWTGEEVEDGNAIPIQGLTHGVAVHLAECCHPLPGDRIVGVLAPGVGVTVHTIDCARLLDSGDDPDEWLDLSWQSSKDTPNFFTGRLHMVMANEAGVLAEITSVVARYGGNISNLRIGDRDPQFFTFDVDVEVRNVKHLTGIITALRSLKVISVAERVRG